MKMTMVFLEEWRNSHFPGKVFYRMSQVQARHLSDLVPKQKRFVFDISLSPQTRSPAPKSETYIREYILVIWTLI